MVSTMLKGKGLKLKHKKTRVSSRSNPVELMELTGLWLNRGAPRVDSRTRRAVRVAVHKCKEAAKIDRTEADYHETFARTSGRVAMLSYLQHAESARLRRSLADILPIYNERDITKTKKIVKMLGRTSAKDRSKYSYNVSYFQAVQRINVVARSQPVLAKVLRQQLSLCKPKKLVQCSPI